MPQLPLVYIFHRKRLQTKKAVTCVKPHYHYSAKGNTHFVPMPSHLTTVGFVQAPGQDKLRRNIGLTG